MELLVKVFWAHEGMTYIPDDNRYGEEKAEKHPESKFFAGGLPHAGSYDPVEGLCWRENYCKMIPSTKRKTYARSLEWRTPPSSSTRRSWVDKVWYLRTI